jgi:glycosyltransferase involved in cell wall biosynthesis
MHPCGDSIPYDLTQGIPFNNNCFDAVYHSHLLEHFSKSYAPIFIQECYRVLKPGGIIRVVVPDLENIARLYLALLQEALAGNEEAQKRYEWIILELFDQMVRNTSGGEMLRYWHQNPMPAEDFVYARMGSEVKEAIAQLRKHNPPLTPPSPSNPLEIGQFRLSGEVHQWMYDRYSLTKLLREAGFEEVRVCRADESQIPDFNSYLLDIEEDGSVRKPDSLFMEAKKPSALLKGHLQTRTLLGQRRPKVLQFCMQDFGGAGIAALRLHEGLMAAGIDSTMYVLNAQRWRPSTRLFSSSIYPLSLESTTFIAPQWNAFCAHNEKILSRYPDRSPYLEIFTDTWAATRIDTIQEIKSADIIHFHWIGGILNIPRDVAILRSKKIIWTLHDMNPFTGGCHYSAGCQKYKYQCGSCPLLGSNQDNDISRQIWKRKNKAYKDLNISVVTPSQWLAQCVQNSSLLSLFPLQIIHNGIPTDIFNLYPKNIIRDFLQIPKDYFIILFGADSATNIRKGFVYLIRALEYLKKLSLRTKIGIVTFGRNTQQAVQHLELPTFTFDYINEEKELAYIYSMADVTIVPSMEDNLPNIALESLACGTPVISFAIGGMTDIITHQYNGYIADVSDYKSLAKGILWTIEQTEKNNKIRIQCRETALKNFSTPTQAQRYIELYNKVIEM